MVIKNTVLAICLVATLPLAAIARQEPSPPPSGIVIHLFGQNSVMSNVLPTAPEVKRADGGGVAAGTAAAPAYVEPSTGDILHEMFVTGDPNDPTRPSTGRAGGPLSH